ncbi:hypothetical protein L596_016357 [Steinernema carpocapsae]|uniref:ShKT domain-containing protein n=1 Tax=Steinernema carpocapsae TaxID=34508 RepID=A0A4U5NHR7_STECR|nr:hypothetical protein L596_016357 [Steinernema carpocapsae]
MASLNVILFLTIALLTTVLLMSAQFSDAHEGIPCANVWSDAKCRRKSHQGNSFLCTSKLERGKHLRAACKKTCHLCHATEEELNFPNHPYKVEKFEDESSEDM